MGNERINAVRDYIQQRGEVSISELQERLYGGYSAMTVWRDLKRLEEQGSIRRVHGGVISMSAATPQIEGLYSRRARENTREKSAIARAALRFVQPGHALYLDAGSTTMALAGRLGRERYTVVTSGANIAIELSQRHSCDVLLTGGQISENTLSCSGALAERFIESVNIDTAFMATSGYAQHAGFTSGSAQESALKRLVLKRAKYAVMLMDSSKLGRALPFTFAGLSDVDAIVCDAALPPEMQRAAEKKNVLCIVAED